jgi:hypothetical protein
MNIGPMGIIGVIVVYGGIALTITLLMIFCVPRDWTAGSRRHHRH